MSNQLAKELHKLNQKLASIDTNKSKWMIYNANPAKFAFYNFLAGIFHSLGSLFGTAVIAALIFYFISQVDLINPIVNWFNQILSQIDWNAIMPSPPTNSQSLDQLNSQLLRQLQQLTPSQ